MKLVLKTVESRQGLIWLQQGVAVFGRQPLALTGLFGTFLFMALLLLLLPVVGGLVVLAAIPLLGLVMMMGTAAAVRGQPVLPSLFLAPLRTEPLRRRRLLALCGLYGAASLLVMALSDLADGGKLDALQELMAAGGDSDQARDRLQALMQDPQLRSGLYLRLTLTALMALPFWHAPALVWWGQQGVAQSMFSSLIALWRCRGAFLLYVAGWFALISVLSLGLGFVLQALDASRFIGVLAMPLAMTLSVMFYASLYFMFVQTFGAGAKNGAEADDEADGGDGGELETTYAPPKPPINPPA